MNGSNAIFNWNIFTETVIYTIFGIFIFVLTIILVEKLSKWSLHKEIIEDQNIALGIMFAGFFIAVSIIIASAIHG